MIDKRMRTVASIIFPAMLAIAALAALQQTARGAPPAEDDAAAKQKIFASQAWQQAMEGLNEWFTVQVIYPQREVPRLKNELVERVNKMSAPELRGYLADLQQKLKIMASPEAAKVRAYVGYNLSVASDAYAAQIRSRLPDVLNMNALQVQQALYAMQQEEASARASEAAFQTQRQEQVKMVQQWNQQTADAINAASAQMPSGGGYAPPVQPWQDVKPVYTPAPIYFGWGWPW